MKPDLKTEKLERIERVLRQVILKDLSAEARKKTDAAVMTLKKNSPKLNPVSLVVTYTQQWRDATQLERLLYQRCSRLLTEQEILQIVDLVSQKS